MVKIRDDLPKRETGEIDIESWAARVGQSFSAHDNQKILKAAYLNLEHGGEQLTCAHESCLRQGLQTAETLLSLEPDASTIIAAILFFPVQYGTLSLETVRADLGEEIASLVSGVSDITTRSLSVQGNESRQDNLRKMLLAVVEDVRVVLIKLAEKITSLRAVALMDEKIKVDLAIQARDIYAPLANRLGIGQIKWELEDFAFRYLEPAAYKQIAKLLAEKRLDRENYIKDLIDQIKSALYKEHIESQVTGRVKHIYSIWRKMLRKNIDFKEVFDVRAIRILVPQIQECYGALGVVHSLWQHIPKEFDDYIATPKENGYRSLHTAVIGPQGRTVEIQIRTFQMHQEAELGVAAHWLYKEGRKADQNYQKKLNALRQLIDLSQQEQQSEFGNELLQEVLEENVYVFTPQGEVIDLPKGSTPLDFAYHIHTDLGHGCRGAKVNGSIVPLNFQLSSGQQIEILSVKEGAPSRDWLNPNLGYLKTARARSKAHNWYKRQAKDENIRQGREMLEKELKRMNLPFSGLAKLLVQIGVKSLEDLFAQVGCGDIRLGQIVNAYQRMMGVQDEPDVILPKLSKHSAFDSEITIQGIGNLLCHFAKCCKPLPGDRIVGYITLGRGVTVHRQDCLNILEKPENEHRLIQVDWGRTTKDVYPVDLLINAYDRQGLLRDITSILSNEKLNVIAVNTATNKLDNIARLVLTIEINDLNALANIITKISQLPNVLEVQRQQEGIKKA